MTNHEVSDSFDVVHNEFWNKYKDRQPRSASPEWERMCTQAAVLKKKYPLMESVINRMMTELIERAMGRGRVPGEFHKPLI